MHYKASQMVPGAWNPWLSWTKLRILSAMSLSHCPELQSSERLAGTIACTSELKNALKTRHLSAHCVALSVGRHLIWLLASP